MFGTYMSISPPRSLMTIAVLLASTFGGPATAQQTGRVEGTVVKASDGTPIQGVSVTVVGTSISTVTDTDGSFALPRVPSGEHVILVRWLGFQPQQASVTVLPGSTQRADIRLDAQVVMLGEITVSAASRVPERIVEAPAAVSVINPVTLRDRSVTGQVPRALEQVPGVDVVQSGMNDFNVNARGFNSSLNRRVLVLQDGRDLAIAFLGSQEWNGMSISLEDVGTLEMVRGPGSALYGANAYSGVINIMTPTARDVLGTKITAAGGELSTIRGDVRHAGISPDGRLGYRLNFGYNRSDSWTESRTALNGSDALAEYRKASDDPVTLSVEAIPLSGQDRDPISGAASGDPDKVQNVYGGSRFDYYADNGSVLTVEGGAAQVENEVFVTGIGRVQVNKALKPWARAAWGSTNYNLMGWYSGRNSLDPQFSLSSGLPLEEKSSIFHFEGQYNRSFVDDKARVVLGASYRNSNVDTQGTLMQLTDDDRSDDYYSGYGQFEYRPIPELRLVGAARVDDGTLFSTQFSPKGAIVYNVNDTHSIRATVNRAFQTPNYSEFFLRVPAAASSTSPATLEGSLEGYYATVLDPATVGPLLAAAMGTLGLPTDLPWNFAAETPVLALGNANLEVEKVTGWEVGYKGALVENAYVSIDLYLNRLSNFVTDLLPGVNQGQYPTYLLTDGGTDVAGNLAAIDAVLAGAGLPAANPLRAGNAALAAGYDALVNSAIGSPALSTVNGTRAVVVSYANAGKVEEKGIELGVGYGFSPEMRVDASYTFFDFDVKETGLLAAGQTIIPNTPKHKVGISLTYTGLQGFDAAISTKFNDSFDWAAGVFEGRVRSRQSIDLNLGYRFNNNTRAFASATNLLDQSRFQLYGGSVIGRRILGGVTATF